MVCKWESSLNAAGALSAAASRLGSIPTPLGSASGCHRDPPARPNSKSAEIRACVLNHSYYELSGLNWPQVPSLIPGSLELQLHG